MQILILILILNFVTGESAIGLITRTMAMLRMMNLGIRLVASCY